MDERADHRKRFYVFTQEKHKAVNFGMVKASGGECFRGKEVDK